MNSDREESKDPQKATEEKPLPASLGETSPEPDINNGHGQPFPVVGIGSSAGGLEALKQFLVATPPDSGMAFTRDANNMYQVNKRLREMVVWKTRRASRLQFLRNRGCMLSYGFLSLEGEHTSWRRHDGLSRGRPLNVFFPTFCAGSIILIEP